MDDSENKIKLVFSIWFRDKCLNEKKTENYQPIRIYSVLFVKPEIYLKCNRFSIMLDIVLIEMGLTLDKYRKKQKQDS